MLKSFKMGSHRILLFVFFSFIMYALYCFLKKNIQIYPCIRLFKNNISTYPYLPNTNTYFESQIYETWTHGDFFRSRDTGGSQFWKMLHKVKHLFKRGPFTFLVMGPRHSSRMVVWVANTPLRIQFGRVYEICEDCDITVAECATREWQIQLTRVMNPETQAEWEIKQEMLQGVLITTRGDEVKWALSSSNKFTTSSLYKFLTSGGVSSKLSNCIWQCKVIISDFNC
jgi:hypothetical protein